MFQSIILCQASKMFHDTLKLLLLFLLRLFTISHCPLSSMLSSTIKSLHSYLLNHNLVPLKFSSLYLRNFIIIIDNEASIRRDLELSRHHLGQVSSPSLNDGLCLKLEANHNQRACALQLRRGIISCPK